MQTRERWTLAAAALVVAAATTAASLSIGSHGDSRVTPPADAPVQATVAGITKFATDFYAAVAEPGVNSVFSPLSVAEMFAMIRAGAAGETAAQLDEAFGYPAGVAGAFNALTRGVVSSDPAPGKPVVSIADGLFVQDGYALAEPFLRTLADHYGADAQPLDFASDSAGAVDAINDWANEHTAGRIPEILSELGPLTRLVVTNAVYLKSRWKDRFDDARPGNFLVGGRATQVPMMHRVAPSGYSSGDGWQAVELPYVGDRLAMRVLVPTGEKTPADLLTPAILKAAAKTRPYEVDLTMPRWDFGTELNLRALLPKLGIKDVFDPARADLSGIAGEDLVVDQAVHKANITVDEVGTEAAAVSGATFVEVSAPATAEVTVDRPFAYVIVDTKTDAPLFLGHVADPRAN